MDSEFLTQSFQFISAHPLAAAIFIFTISMAESLLIVGMFIPGIVVMLGIGTLIGAGVLHFGWVLFLSLSGAIVGDAVSFWIGQRFRDRIPHWWPFNKKPELLTSAETYFVKHGGKSVFFGRFIGPLRAVIPATAAMMGMSSYKFLIYNILSAAIWAPVILLPGVVFGASLEMAGEVTGRLTMVLLLVLVHVAILFGLVWRINRFFVPRLELIAQSSARWALRHPRLGPIVEAMIDPQQPETRAIALLSFSFVLLLTLLAVFTGRLFGDGHVFNTDNLLASFLQGLHTPWLDHLLGFFIVMSSPWVILSLVVGGSIALGRFRDARAITHWVAAIAICVGILILLAVWWRVPSPAYISLDAVRSANLPVELGGISAALGYLAVLLSPAIPVAWRWLVYALAALWALLVAVAYWYFGIYWPSEILLALVTALVVSALLGLLYRRRVPVTAHAPLVIGVGVVVLLAMTFTLYGLQSDEISAQLNPPPKYALLKADEWWERKIQPLPDYRQDTRGKLKQFFTLQWRGQAKDIEDTLLAMGWQRPIDATVENSLRWFLPDPALSDLPILPHAHGGRHETLLLTRPMADNEQAVIRLWHSGYIDQNGVPYWVATVTRQSIVTVAGLAHFPRTVALWSPDVPWLADVRRMGWEVKLIPRNKGRRTLYLLRSGA